MQKLTLSWRLGLAFGVMLVLTGVIGGLAVWRMHMAKSTATDMDTKQVPKVRLSQSMISDTQEARFWIRNYALTGEEVFLSTGRKRIAALREELKAAGDLASKYPDLVVLARGTEAAQASVDEWETLIDKSVAEHKSLAAQSVAMDAAAQAYLQACLAMRISQQQLLNGEIEEKADPAKLQERLVKTRSIENLINLGNNIRIDNRKAQASDDLDAQRDTLNAFTTVADEIDRLGSSLNQQTDIDQLAKVQEAANAYKIAVERDLKGHLAIGDIKKNMLETATALVAAVDDVAKDGMQAIDQSQTQMANGLAMTSLILIIGLVFAVIVGALVAWMSTRAITGPIREGVNALGSTAAEITTTISQLASNASETAAAVSQATTTVDEVRQTAQVSADKAKAVADSAEGSSRAADSGRQATEQTIQGLDLIRDQMASISESVTRLSEQSQAVGDIVSTVTDLAEQSNLLAVNASIEAAKAGDQGKGFAVVAQEIRNLAEQSKESTKQVRAILTDVQRATGNAVQAAEQGGQSVADGGRQAAETGQAIGTLTATVKEANQAAVQIAASSQQQLTGMEQVGRAMENIKQATTQNAEGARQLATVAHGLQELGARLKSLVDADGNRALATVGE